MKVVVIGAGPAGITAAYSLVKSNLQVDVYEASAEVGGLAKTIDWRGANLTQIATDSTSKVCRLIAIPASDLLGTIRV